MPCASDALSLWMNSTFETSSDLICVRISWIVHRGELRELVRNWTFILLPSGIYVNMVILHRTKCVECM